MKTRELQQAVARATGEDISVIAALGFSLLDDEASPEDELLDRFLDWDEVAEAA